MHVPNGISPDNAIIVIALLFHENSLLFQLLIPALLLGRIPGVPHLKNNDHIVVGCFTKFTLVPFLCSSGFHRHQILVMMLCHITGGTRGCHNDNYCLPVKTKFSSWHLLVFSGLIDQEAVFYRAMAGCQLCDRPFPEPLKMAMFCDAVLWYLTIMGWCTGFIFAKEHLTRQEQLSWSSLADSPQAASQIGHQLAAVSPWPIAHKHD